MVLSSILMPIKFLIIGISTVLNFVFNTLRVTSLFLFQGISKLLSAIVKGLFFLVGRILLGLKLVVTYILKYTKLISLNIIMGIKAIILFIVKYIKLIILFLVKYLKLFLVYFFAGIKRAIVIIFGFLKTIVVFIYQKTSLIIFNLIKIISTVIRNLFRGISTSLNYVVIGIRLFIKYTRIVLSKIFMSIKIVANFFVKGIIKILKSLVKIPRFIWSKFERFGVILFTIFVEPIVYYAKLFHKSIRRSFGSSKGNTEKFKKSIAGTPRRIKEGIINWYNNISFIKDVKNRKEMRRQTLLINFETEDAVRSEQKIPYRYEARTPEGKVERGVLSAYSRLDVHSYLLAEGYEVYEIELFKGLNVRLRAVHKVKNNELVFLLTQLSTYIKAGIPLVDSIKILSKQSGNTGMKNLYRSIIYELTMGESFSESLGKQGNSFPKLLVNMVKSAELAGNLPETLDNMAEYYTAIYKTNRQMIMAMMYPSVIFVFATTIIAFILIFVIPEFVSIYRDMGSELPVITQLTIAFSDYLQRNILYIILTIIGIGFALSTIYANVKMFKMLVQWVMMHTPVIGKVIIYNEVTMFSKTFGSLLNHNVFITDSMEILSKITSNEIYKMLIFDTITNLARGDSISKSFKNHWAFPIVAYEMLLTGERTGQPGPMMNKVADYYQEEHRNAVNQIKVFIEPIMIVFLTVVVGLILLSVILPMFNLYGGLGG
jgi:type IV pilus assembly protein PilC